MFILNDVTYFPQFTLQEATALLTERENHEYDNMNNNAADNMELESEEAEVVTPTTSVNITVSTAGDTPGQTSPSQPTDDKKS